ncbi:MAG: UDP-N-acetylmuramoyl-tripeptide--D-alanyl-D-alanine ligase [Alicyclobacillus sp.]|nr:UDP-N-acetylmuramoyl-tripeptide--D-alanyl-D-alanine ligase [Alicyclobacillus sp.]
MLALSAVELTRIVEGVLRQGKPRTVITGASIDTRTLQSGDLFAAFTGQQHDGHAFIPQAIDRGATAVLVTREVVVADPQVPVIQVSDPLRALQRLARHERRSFRGPVIGVTGSNGKTTTKDMLSTVFSVGGPCLATHGNFNTELGLPLTILRRQPSNWSMILEMGMRGLGQIAELCDIARPTAGIITNIGQSHLELLGSQEKIAQAKGELLEAIPKSGVAALTYGDPWLERIAKKCRGQVYWYGIHEAAHAKARDIVHTSQGIRFVADVLGQSATVQLPTFGVLNVTNALGALLLGALHGLPLDAMADALRTLPPAAGRLRVLPGVDGRSVIDDCYNASPLSMRASLKVLTDIAEGKPTAAILGDMYELGEYEEPGHREVGEACAALGVDSVICVGPRAAWIAEAARQGGVRTVYHYPDKASLLADLQELLPKDGVVLVKASRGMHLEELVDVLTAPVEA